MYLVRWAHAGYVDSWEVYRAEGRGEVGTVVATWELLEYVRHTVALQEWRVAQVATQAGEDA